MAEDNLLGMSNRAQHLRRVLIGHGIEAALKHLTIDGDAIVRGVRLLCQPRAMLSERSFQRFGREMDKRIANGCMGRCPFPLEP